MLGVRMFLVVVLAFSVRTTIILLHLMIFYHIISLIISVFFIQCAYASVPAVPAFFTDHSVLIGSRKWFEELMKWLSREIVHSYDKETMESAYIESYESGVDAAYIILAHQKKIRAQAGKTPLSVDYKQAVIRVLDFIHTDIPKLNNHPPEPNTDVPREKLIEAWNLGTKTYTLKNGI